MVHTDRRIAAMFTESGNVALSNVVSFFMTVGLRDNFLRIIEKVVESPTTLG